MGTKNEEYIKECLIEVNNKKIPFSYQHIFEEEGFYEIRYSFIKNLNSINYIFCECFDLVNVDFSNFYSNNITDMRYMLYLCSSLTYINLSGFNTESSITMEAMFAGCSSLKNLDLSSFNTTNVTNMGFMFTDCGSLKNLDLSKFNTQNVTNFNHMFQNCNSLIELNISNFSSGKAGIVMFGVFWQCHSLKKLTARDQRLIKQAKKDRNCIIF